MCIVTVALSHIGFYQAPEIVVNATNHVTLQMKQIYTQITLKCTYIHTYIYIYI